MCFCVVGTAIVALRLWWGSVRFHGEQPQTSASLVLVQLSCACVVRLHNQALVSTHCQCGCACHTPGRASEVTVAAVETLSLLWCLCAQERPKSPSGRWTEKGHETTIRGHGFVKSLSTVKPAAGGELKGLEEPRRPLDGKGPRNGDSWTRI